VNRLQLQSCTYCKLTLMKCFFLILFTALKLSHVDMYTRKLRERSRRKRLCRDYQLVSNYFTITRRDKPAGKKKTSKYER
jgi:hypothetical protein